MDPTNWSDLRILAEMERAAVKGDQCAHRRLADELRRRLHHLRLEQLNYHVEERENKLPAPCDA